MGQYDSLRGGVFVIVLILIDKLSWHATCCVQCDYKNDSSEVSMFVKSKFAQSKNQTFKRLLNVSNIVLVVTTVAMLISILMSYPYAEHFSLPVQVAAHISTIVIAAFLKVSYVTRCLAQYNLGMQVR